MEGRTTEEAASMTAVATLLASTMGAIECSVVDSTIVVRMVEAWIVVEEETRMEACVTTSIRGLTAAEMEVP